MIEHGPSEITITRFQYFAIGFIGYIAGVVTILYIVVSNGHCG